MTALRNTIGRVFGAYLERWLTLQQLRQDAAAPTPPPNHKPGFAMICGRCATSPPGEPPTLRR